MRVDRTSSVPPSSGSGISGGFRITWQDGSDRWHIRNQNDVPMSTVRQALTEVLNRDRGRSFLLPSLGKAAGFRIVPERLDRNLKVWLVQEGANSGIFRVDAKVKRIANQGPKTFSFCLNAARNPSLNDLHEKIFRNLGKLRAADPRYVVEPFAFGLAAARHEEREVELAVISTEWLDGFTEVNMFNAAEAVDGGPPLNGLEVAGLRQVRFNEAGKTFREGIIKDGKLANSIASEMVKILVLYFDSQAARPIVDYGINSGDFVYRVRPDGGFDLKLVTCREIREFPELTENQEFAKGFILLEELLNHRENSVHYQARFAGAEFRKYAIYTFTPTDVCRGIKSALIERYGVVEGRPVAHKFLYGYLRLSEKMQEMMPAESKEVYFRRIMIRTEIEAFLKNE